ncbi:hypothetical protein B9J07_25630 [Sinorhizobium sp. LM21]|nr:methyltransferase [Sinorhizobium phage phi3LM21]OWZ90939.1 hypothetical protein B9J07_25630 [Sinorhizobium sp. LM21]
MQLAGRLSAGGLSASQVTWVFQLLLERDPSQDEIDARLDRYSDIRQVRNEIIRSPEYVIKNGGNVAYREAQNVFADLMPYGVNGLLCVNLSDYIGLSIVNAQYELDEVAFVKKRVKPGYTFVDVGANIGLFTIIASDLVWSGGKVFAFEPVPATLHYLRRSIAANRFCSNVTIMQTIVADRSSDDFEIAFQPIEEGSGSSGGSFIVNKCEQLAPHLKREAIGAEPMDKLISEGEKVHFIKVDIEGAEPLAMKGAERILSTYSPLVMSEVHPAQLQAVSKTDWRGYFELMRGYGYTPFFFQGEELTEEARHLDDDKVYSVAFVKK